MPRKSVFMLMLALLWTVGGLGSAHALKKGAERRQQQTDEAAPNTKQELKPHLVLIGLAPAMAFSDCQSLGAVMVPIALYFFPQSEQGDPAMIIGQVDCTTTSSEGEKVPLVVPIFFPLNSTAPPTHRPNSYLPPRAPTPQHQQIPGANFVPGHVGSTDFIG